MGVQPHTVTFQPSSSNFSEADRAHLARLLSDPVLATATNIAIRDAQPNAHRLAQLDQSVQAAISNQLAGMTELVQRLTILATPIAQLTPKQDVTGEEWAHEEEDPSTPTQ